MEKKTERVPEYLSRKLRLLSFTAIVAVALIHAYNYADAFLQPFTRLAAGLHAPAMTEFFFANALVRFANPLFFAISGYLLFAGRKEFSAADYLNTIKKRTISLVVPYMFWVFLWTLIGLLIMSLLGSRATEIFPLLKYKLGDWQSAPFNCIYDSPLPFQFWFIKDLMKLMLLSPLFFLLASRLGPYSMLVFTIPWLLDFTIPYMPHNDGMMAFMVGTYIAVSGTDWERFQDPLQKRSLLLFPCLWVLLCLGYTFLSAWDSGHLIPDMLLTIVYKLCMALGVVSVFVVFDFLPDSIRYMPPARVPTAALVIYATHEPLQHFVFQYIMFEERSDFVHLLLFFGLPLLFVFLGILLDALLKKYAPNFRAFATGGR